MAQRNPMNERYTGEGPGGKTKKSAASAKPKRKAAASVKVRQKPVTAAEKRDAAAAKRKVEKAKNRERQEAVAKVVPTSPEFKKYRRLWLVLIISAVVCTALSWVLRAWIPDENSFVYAVVLVIAYAGILGAIYIDVRKVRPMRKAAQAEFSMSNKKKKIAEKEAAERKAAEEAAEAEKVAKKAAKKGKLLGKKDSSDAASDEKTKSDE